MSSGLVAIDRSVQVANVATQPTQEPDLPAKKMRLRVVDDLVEIRQIVRQSTRLAEMAIEPNVFYESLMLLPALEHLAGGTKVSLGVIEAPKRRNPDGTTILCALIPFVRHRGNKSISLWSHDYSFVGTPLFRRDCCELAIRTMFDWFEANNLWAWCFSGINVDGPFHRTLWAELQRRRLPFWIQRQDLRAAFKPAEDYESFRQRSISRSTRSEIQRCANRLRSEGALTCEQLSNSDELESWTNQFLELESRGWKGRHGTALNASSAHAKFFQEAAFGAFSERRLVMLKLSLDGNPIAMNSAFLADEGGFYFKIAYDEAYRKYSPGSLLELEFAKWLHQQPEVNWIDSCAKPNHPMIDRIWDDRRNIQTYWIGASNFYGSATLSTLAAAYQTKDLLKKRKKKHEPRSKTANHSV